MAANRSSWGAAGPSYILAAARAGTTELHVGRADNLYQLASAFTIRVSLGAPNQEDFDVASVAPLHGGADERHALRLARPASRAHAPLELIRVVHPEAILATRFEVHAAGERLFDAYIDGVDPPRLAATAPLALKLEKLTPAGVTAANEADRATLRAATHAVRGWACFTHEARHLGAAAVEIRLTPFLRGSQPFSRGAGEEDALPPLAGLLDLRRRRGYWTNLTASHSGWVAKVGLADYERGARWEVAGLSSWEERALAIGQIRAWDSTLYARFAVNSEAGLVPSANAWGDDEDGEPMVRIAYRVL